MILDGLELDHTYANGVKVYTLAGRSKDDNGYVSVDFSRRIWEVGSTSMIRRCHSHTRYSGRGWQQELLTDALNTLKEIYGERPVE